MPTLPTLCNCEKLDCDPQVPITMQLVQTVLKRTVLRYCNKHSALHFRFCKTQFFLQIHVSRFRSKRIGIILGKAQKYRTGQDDKTSEVRDLYLLVVSNR